MAVKIFKVGSIFLFAARRGAILQVTQRYDVTKLLG